MLPYSYQLFNPPQVSKSFINHDPPFSYDAVTTVRAKRYVVYVTVSA
jgi:hypothetical protein